MNQSPIYQLKVTLREFRPPIWRRVLIYSTATFYELHSLIQDAFGWGNGHLHGFRRSRFKDWQYDLHIQDPALTAEWGVEENAKWWTRQPKRVRETRPRYPDEFTTPLADYLSLAYPRIVYTYDYGDDWEHDILLEKVLDADTKTTVPVVVAGKGNSPIEDSRGWIEDAAAIVEASHNKSGITWKRLLRDWGDADELNGIVELCEIYLNDEFDPKAVKITSPAEQLKEWKQWQSD